MYLEEAARKGLISADEYLDAFGEPRRPWPEVIDHGQAYCVLCQQFFSSRYHYKGHMKTFHLELTTLDRNKTRS